MMSRIFYNILIILSLLYTPFYITFIFLIAGMFLFKDFYEGIIYAFVYDTVFGRNESNFLGVYTIYTFLFFMLFLIVKKMKMTIVMD